MRGWTAILRIAAFLLKSCSQLNPIERFWKHLKSLACANKLFPDIVTLVASIDHDLAQQIIFNQFSLFIFKELFVRYLTSSTGC